MLNAEFSGGGPNTPDIVADGGAVLLDILIGGTPAPGLVIGGGYHIAASSADYEEGPNSSGSGAALGQGILGPFVDWFPMPDQGLDVGILFGMAIVSFDAIGIFSRDTEIDQRGFGASPFVGYTLWLADQWSLGLSARATWATTSGDKIYEEGMSRTLGATLTAIYH